MDTIENNKLIAEFMGCVENPNNGVWNTECPFEGKGHDLETMKYHTSWDWLIPVIKKINLQLHPDTRGAWRMITNCVEYKIEDVHNQVVQFINQYNENENERLNNEYISYNDAPYGQD